MESERNERENMELKARLKAFAAVFRLGADAFSLKTLEELAVHIVNDSRGLLPFVGATFLDLRGGRCRTVAQYAQVAVNEHSPRADALRCVAQACAVTGKYCELGAENVTDYSAQPAVKESLALLTQEDRRLLLVPLVSMRVPDSQTQPFVWVMEFERKVPAHCIATANLLAVDYAGAAWGIATAGRRWRSGRHMPRWVWTVGVALVIFGALFLIRIEHNIAAEFVLRPQELHHSTAWFDCVVKQCFFEDGDTVKKGERILEYDTDRIRFQLAAAETAAREANAQFEQESRAAFSDRERLGKLKLLDYKRKLADVAVDEARWFLQHSSIYAPADGILALADGAKDRLEGRSLRSGERQFDVLGTGSYIAEIMVNEKDASILKQLPKVTLFLHTQPELPIPATVRNMRYYPTLTEQNIYSYVVRGTLDSDVPGVRCGMRGVARLSGEQVSLAYWLFRSVVLWYRGA